MWRIHTLTRREGWVINHKKTHRIYCEEGLNLRRKRPRRRVAAMHRESRPTASSMNEAWSMDFVADELFNGRRIRALTIVDNFSREALAIVVDHTLKGTDVVAAVELLTPPFNRLHRAAYSGASLLNHPAGEMFRLHLRCHCGFLSRLYSKKSKFSDA